MYIEFTEDFATRKKGEKVDVGEELAMYLINVDKVAKVIEPIKAKKEKVIE